MLERRCAGDHNVAMRLSAEREKALEGEKREAITELREKTEQFEKRINDLEQDKM